MDGSVEAFRPAVSRDDGCGINITIRHNDGSKSKYCHLRYLKAISRNGQTIKKGQIIGYVGNTGRSKGNHLHFEYTAPNATNPSDPADANLPNAVFPLIP
jgi:murein DD-endopeptidase MepM/ murein hydrolase activator NlpD